MSDLPRGRGRLRGVSSSSNSRSATGRVHQAAGHCTVCDAQPSVTSVGLYSERRKGSRLQADSRLPEPCSRHWPPTGNLTEVDCSPSTPDRLASRPHSTRHETGAFRLTPRHRRRCRKPEWRASADSWRQLAAGASLTIPGTKAGGYGVSCPVIRRCGTPPRTLGETSTTDALCQLPWRHWSVLPSLTDSLVGTREKVGCRNGPTGRCPRPVGGRSGHSELSNALIGNPRKPAKFKEHTSA